MGHSCTRARIAGLQGIIWQTEGLLIGGATDNSNRRVQENFQVGASLEGTDLGSLIEPTPLRLRYQNDTYPLIAPADTPFVICFLKRM